MLIDHFKAARAAPMAVVHGATLVTLRDNERASLEELGVDHRDVAVVAEVADKYDRIARALNRHHTGNPSLLLRPFAELLLPDPIAPAEMPRG